MVKRGVEHNTSCKDLGESSDSAFQEEIETSKSMCQHVGKSVNLADIKRQLRSNRRVGACDKKVPTPCTAPSDGAETVPSGASLPHGVWLCTQCGHQGCAGHATQHFNTPRSDSHALAVDTADWAVWCFTCKEKVSLKSNKKLHEAVQFVKKKQGTLRPAATPTKEDAGTSKSSKNATSKDKPVQDRDHDSLPKVKGLINLGNSCYLNSVLQCLSQCHYLTHYLDIGSRSGRKVTVSEEGRTMELVLPEGGPITACLCDFLKQMHTAGTTATVSPSHLFRKIALKVPQFANSDQQDAHELLRALMEQARLEDLRRHQRQIMLGLGLPTKTDPKQVPDDLKTLAKALGRQVSHTTIDSIFSGQLVSLVVCQACMARTHRMEPFLDLSLPVAEDKPTRPRKPCGTAAEDEDAGEFILMPKSSGAGRTSKHALKKERKAARRAKKHGQSAAAPDDGGGGEPAPKTEVPANNSDSGQELDRRSDAASAEGESDADEEDNGDTDLVIDSLLPEPDEPPATLSPEPPAGLSPDEPPATVSPDPPGESASAAAAAELSERLSALALCPPPPTTDPETLLTPLHSPTSPGRPPSSPGRPPSPLPSPPSPGDPALARVASDPELRPAVSVPLVGGDARQCATAGEADRGGAGDAERAQTPAGGRTGEDGVGKAQNGAMEGARGADGPGVAQSGVDGLNGRNSVQEGAALESAPPTNGPVCGAESGVGAGDRGKDAPRDGVSNGPVRDADGTGPAQSGGPAGAAEDGGVTEAPVNGETAACSGDVTKSTEPPSEPAEAGTGDGPPPLSRSEWLSRALTTLAPRYQAAPGECSLLTCLNQYTAPELLAGNNKFGCESCTEMRNRRLTPQENGEKKPGTVYSNASKQLLVYSPPPVLTVHLKRFEVCAFSLRKVNRHVQFGERLDLAPFCSSIGQDLPQMRSGQRRVLYSLFGVVEHSGRLTSGHYTAYVRVRRRSDRLTVNPAMMTTLVTDGFRLACERARRRAEQTEKDAGEGSEGLAAERGESAGDETGREPEPEPEPGRWFHVSDTHVAEVTLDKVLKAQAYLLFYERIV